MQDLHIKKPLFALSVLKLTKEQAEGKREDTNKDYMNLRHMCIYTRVRSQTTVQISNIRKQILKNFHKDPIICSYKNLKTLFTVSTELGSKSLIA